MGTGSIRFTAISIGRLRAGPIRLSTEEACGNAVCFSILMHFDLRLVYFCVFLIVFSEMWCIWLLLMASGQLGAMININRVSEMGFVCGKWFI